MENGQFIWLICKRSREDCPNHHRCWAKININGPNKFGKWAKSTWKIGKGNMENEPNQYGKWTKSNWKMSKINLEFRKHQI